MKRFDPQAILERQVKLLQSKDNWTKLQSDGATYQLMEAFAEPIAEVARYGEYLLQEMKWDTCRNFSSVKHMARLVGKKLNRKHSAIGNIIVSHSDPEGISRYAYLGVSNFDIDAQSNYDDLEKDENLTDILYTQSLVPWTDVSTYTIPQGATFKTTSGVNFICAESRSIKSCNKAWSTVSKTAESLQSFKASDGWNYYKYLSVPVVQGTQKTVTLGYSTGEASQTFNVATLDIEAADSYYTKQFLYVEVEDTEGNVTTWSEINHLQLAESVDKVFEINILDDLTGTQIKFGNSINGAIPSQNALIILHYLETQGSEGNVTDLYNFQTEIEGAELPSETTYTNLSLGCQNMWPIIGGKDLETLAEFKENAETAYSKNYEILHTFSELEENINSISPIPLIKTELSTFYSSQTVGSTTISVPTIGITGLSTALIPLNSSEITLFNSTVNNELNDKVLSNKKISYISPNLITIDTSIEIETKTAVSSIVDFATGVEDYLTANYGQASLSNINAYKQVDLLKGVINYNDNIGSIQATSLLTLAATDILYGYVNASNDLYFLFTFEWPKLKVNSTSLTGSCESSYEDGTIIPYIFNININSNACTICFQETSNTENTIIAFEASSYFDSNAEISLYKNSSNAKYVGYECSKEKHVFTLSELKDISNLSTKTSYTYTSSSGDSDVYFYREKSGTLPKQYLAIPASTVAKQLGFTEYSASNIVSIYNALLSSIDSNYSSIKVSLRFVDNTIETSDWNTIMYYDNIGVTVSNPS